MQPLKESRLSRHTAVMWQSSIWIYSPFTSETVKTVCCLMLAHFVLPNCLRTMIASLPILPIGAACVITIGVWLAIRAIRGRADPPYPPDPRGLPILGNMLDIDMKRGSSSRFPTTSRIRTSSCRACAAKISRCTRDIPVSLSLKSIASPGLRPARVASRAETSCFLATTSTLWSFTVGILEKGKF